MEKEKQRSGCSSRPESSPDRLLTCQCPHLKWHSNHGKATRYLLPVSTGHYFNRPFTSATLSIGWLFLSLFHIQRT